STSGGNHGWTSLPQTFINFPACHAAAISRALFCPGWRRKQGRHFRRIGNAETAHSRRIARRGPGRKDCSSQGLWLRETRASSKCDAGNEFSVRLNGKTVHCYCRDDVGRRREDQPG